MDGKSHCMITVHGFECLMGEKDTCLIKPNVSLKSLASVHCIIICIIVLLFEM